MRVVVVLLALLVAFAYADPSACSDCQKLVAWIEDKLSGPQTESKIEQALDTVCTMLPPADQAKCQNFVDKYIPEAIGWIMNHETPQNACTQVHLCSSSDAGAVMATTTPPPPSVPCRVCEIVAAVAELYIASHPNDTETEVLDEMYKVCNASFMQKYTKECDIFVDFYGKPVLAAIFAGKSAEQVCSSTFPPLCPSMQQRSPVNRMVMVRERTIVMPREVLEDMLRSRAQRQAMLQRQ